MRNRILPILAVVCATGAQPDLANADQIEFAAGRRLEGIVIDETATHLHLQIAWQGFMTIDKRAVASVAKTDANDRERLREGWRAEHEEQTRRESDRRAFEREQREKGFVQYLGQWISREELAAIQAHHAARAADRERREQREELERLAARIDSLEAENRRLQSELTARPTVSVVRSPVVAWPSSRWFRDRRGNWFHAHHHNDGAECLLHPHGGHLKVRLNNGRFFFDDRDGDEHELELADKPS